MSAIRANTRPVNSSEINSINLAPIELNQQMQKYDFVQMNQAYVRNCVIKNFSDDSLLYWRNSVHAAFDTIPPLSEIPVKGWFSFLDLRSDPDIPNSVMEGLLTVEIVKINEAVL